MLWVCAGQECGAAFSVGAERCPQCGGNEYRPQGEEDGPALDTRVGEPAEASVAGEDDAGAAGEDGEPGSAGKTARSRKPPR